MEDIANRLRIARERSGLSIEDAASALSVPYPTYAGHENGTGGFRIPQAIKYARKFKVSLDWLLTGKGKGPGELDEALDEMLALWPNITDERREALLQNARIFAASTFGKATR
jgi:transcriptional regulator with XRE-family HTH domain